MNILMVSLGCDKNLCDSEAMLGMLHEKGYNITSDESMADAIVINTCSFIHDAMEESVNTILEITKLKKDKLKYILVTGCLAERFKDEIGKEISEIDAIIGTTSFDKIVEVLEELEARTSKKVTSKDCANDHEIVKCFDDINRLPIIKAPKIITSSTFMGYIKIAEGCNKFCTYCAIPYMRGSYRSVPMDTLIEEAKYMSKQGIKEIILVAQETTCYGIDLYGEKKLHELIKQISLIPEIEWIRVMYCYPEEITDELIETFANEPKLCKYIDMPLQHSEDSILARMGRKTNKKSIIEIINKLRKAAPEIAIRTSLIAGFPGETKEDHEALLKFIDEIEFDRLGVFTYSREEGTRAAEFENQVPEELANTWRNEIMELQQEISYDKNESMIGKTLKIIIEGYSSNDNVYVGRSYKDAPNVDGLVFVECDYELISGTIVDVIIKEANEYDLIGEIKNEFTK